MVFSMQIKKVLFRGWPYLVDACPDLSSEARRRLAWFDYYRRHGNVSKTCRHFGVQRGLFYRWLERFDPRNLKSLESASKRPKKVRAPMWSKALEKAVQRCRESYPRWGKEKLVILVRREGFETSESTVGRILTSLRKRGLLKEPVRYLATRRHRPMPRPYAVRKPREYRPESPGDLIEVDTMDIRFGPDFIRRQFSSQDVVSKWSASKAFKSATARNASDFLDRLIEKSPFPIRAIQVDGGSEFKAEFEEACHLKNIRLFALPPRSPKLNGQVERVNRSYTEEFYQVHPIPFDVALHNKQLDHWDHVYNTIRPHHALRSKTPQEFLDSLRENPTRLSPMY